MLENEWKAAAEEKKRRDEAAERERKQNDSIFLMSQTDRWYGTEDVVNVLTLAYVG